MATTYEGHGLRITVRSASTTKTYNAPASQAVVLLRHKGKVFMTGRIMGMSVEVEVTKKSAQAALESLGEKQVTLERRNGNWYIT